MRTGRRPPRTSASAARRPAGPAPTTTTASATRGSVDRDRHAGFDPRGAGAQPASVGETDPADLTAGHEAEAGAMGIAKLEAAQGRPMQQDGSQQEIALTRLGRC